MFFLFKLQVWLIQATAMPFYAERGGDGGRDEDRRRKKQDLMPPRDFRVFNEKGQLDDGADYYIVESASFGHTSLG